MSTKSRRRATRRDRRRAKQLGFRRLPKKAGKVGHGSGLTIRLRLGAVLSS